MRIGYQGDVGSNAEEAAELFEHIVQETSSEKEILLIPCITSLNVFQHLKENDKAFGVVATRNTIGGEVQETQEMFALAEQENYDIDIISTCTIPIHHCLFTKNENTSIDVIASHPQALKQTQRTRQELYPQAAEQETIDTAYAAKMLANGELPDNYGILCRKNAGEQYNLFLQQENLEDEQSFTTFVLFSIKKK